SRMPNEEKVVPKAGTVIGSPAGSHQQKLNLLGLLSPNNFTPAPLGRITENAEGGSSGACLARDAQTTEMSASSHIFCGPFVIHQSVGIPEAPSSKEEVCQSSARNAS